MRIGLPRLLCIIPLVAQMFFIACTSKPHGVRLVSKPERAFYIYVQVNEPTAIIFPTNVRGGLKGPFANCSQDSYGVVHREDNVVVIFAIRDLPASGKKQLILTDDNMEYSFIILQADESHPRDEWIGVTRESLKLCQSNSLCPKVWR